jgi:hypothetical protein
LRVSKLRAAEEGRKQLERTTGDRPMQGMVEEIVKNSLRENRRAMIGGMLDSAYEDNLNLIGAGGGANIRETATLGMQSLEMRKQMILDAQTFGANTGDEQRIANLDRAIGQIAQLLAEAEAPQTTESVRMEREIAEGRKPIPARDATSEQLPEEKTDTLTLLKAMLEKIDQTEAKQAQENLAAQQLEVLKSIEAKSGVAPDANANAIRAQVMGAG